MSDQILNDPRAGWAMALCSGDCNRAWLLSDLWFLDGEIICDDCLHDADGPDDRLARAQPFIGPDKRRIAELEDEIADLTKRLAAAEGDTARLEWMQQGAEVVSYALGGFEVRWDNKKTAEYPTIREAIDAARRETNDD